MVTGKTVSRLAWEEGCRHASHLAPLLLNPFPLSCYFKSGFCCGTLEHWGFFSLIGKVGSPGSPRQGSWRPTIAMPWGQPLTHLRSQETSGGWAGETAGMEIPLPEHLCFKNSPSKFRCVWKHSGDKKSLNHQSREAAGFENSREPAGMVKCKSFKQFHVKEYF